MFCNRSDKKAWNLFWVMLGIITIMLGIFMQYSLPDNASNYMRFAGMMTGFGSGILGVAVVGIIRNHFSTPEKLKEREIEKKDERNIQIMRAAYAAAACGALILFILMGFLFTFLGEYRACSIVLGAMYLDICVFAGAYLMLQKKM